MSFLKKYRKLSQHKARLKQFYNAGNSIIIIEGEKTIVNPAEFLEFELLRIPWGGVQLIIHRPFAFKMLSLDVCGNLSVEICENIIEPVGHIRILKAVGDVKNYVYIGKGSGIGDAVFDVTLHGNIEIGDACTMSWGVMLKTDDTHPIYQNGKIINRSKNIIIGKNVWIGMHASILKNSMIPDGAIVGAYSVVAGRFDEKNTVIAGNPAKVVKHDIEWKCGLIEYSE